MNFRTILSSSTCPPSAGSGQGEVQLDDLPQDVKRQLIATMPLDSVCRLGSTCRSWRELSGERPELAKAALAPLLRANEHAAAARVLTDRTIAPRLDLDRADAYGMTALMVAAAQGKSSAVESLLRLGASAMPTDRARLSAKTWAALGMHTDSWNLLQFVDDRSERPMLSALEFTQMPTDVAAMLPTLMEAAKMGHAPLVAALVARGENLRITDDEGCTPLHHLARQALHAHEALDLVVGVHTDLLRAATGQGHTLAHIIGRYAPHPQRGLAYLAAHGCPLNVVARDGLTPWMMVRCWATDVQPALAVLSAAGGQPMPDAANRPADLRPPQRRGGYLFG